MEGMQPPILAMLRVLDTLSCGSLARRIVHGSDTDVIGCAVVDDTTVDSKVVGFPLRSWFSLSLSDA